MIGWRGWVYSRGAFAFFFALHFPFFFSFHFPFFERPLLIGVFYFYVYHSCGHLHFEREDANLLLEIECRTKRRQYRMN